MSYKIIHFSESDIGGGSAFYAYRLHKYLNKIQKVNSKMFVLKKNLNDNSIKKLERRHVQRIIKNEGFIYENYQQIVKEFNNLMDFEKLISKKLKYKIITN
tara:strand:+ start:199 stop:501 length:303 start_codon:yes stop_codon:yes gene_type:complete